jgi:ubiquinone/menaquinone biosynthesis C-methylase UbiE
MGSGTRRYRWYYDNIQSRVYNIGARWWFLPFGGERRVRQSMISAIGLGRQDRVLDMCCGTGGATFVMRGLLGADTEVFGIDLSVGQLR